jgi:hypothetical protein
MSPPAASSPPPQRSAVDEFGAFSAGMLLFVPVDYVLAASLAQHGSLFAGLAFLAGVVAITWGMARTRWRWTGLGMAAGFALMTLLTGGVCTLFGGDVGYPVGGLLYFGICIVLVLIATILTTVQAARRRRPPAPPQP